MRTWLTHLATIAFVLAMAPACVRDRTEAEAVEDSERWFSFNCEQALVDPLWITYPITCSSPARGQAMHFVLAAKAVAQVCYPGNADVVSTLEQLANLVRFGDRVTIFAETGRLQEHWDDLIKSKQPWTPLSPPVAWADARSLLRYQAECTARDAVEWPELFAPHETYLKQRASRRKDEFGYPGRLR
jgi:hypothetical protein